MKTLIVLILLSSTVKAATLECKSFVNLQEVSQSTIETQLLEKVIVDRIDKATSYVTEMKDGSYLLEAFIPSLEIRIYSEANLSQSGDKIKVSIWDRDFMADVICKKLK